MTLIAFNQVTLKHSANDTPAIANLTFTINEHDMIVLLGRNGSGKSTLLKLLSNQLHPTYGSIEMPTFNATDVFSLNQYSNDSLFPSLTVNENARIICNVKKADLKDALNKTNPNLINKLDLPVDRLSGGEKQALALTLAFIHPPKVLLLDEHTSALDPITSLHLMALTNQLVKQHKITCIMTTHDLDIALTYGNQLLIMQNGRLTHSFNHQEKSRLSKDQLIREYY